MNYLVIYWHNGKKYIKFWMAVLISFWLPSVTTINIYNNFLYAEILMRLYHNIYIFQVSIKNKVAVLFFKRYPALDCTEL